MGRPEYQLGMNAVEFTELKQEENEELQQKSTIIDQSETIAKRKRKNKSTKLMNGFFGDFIFISFYFLGIQVSQYLVKLIFNF
jgi:hypothetical protein